MCMYQPTCISFKALLENVSKHELEVMKHMQDWTMSHVLVCDVIALLQVH